MCFSFPTISQPPYGILFHTISNHQNILIKPLVNRFKMPPKPTKTLFSVDEVLEAVLDDDGDELSEFEYGDLSEEEEELIDNGVDPDLLPEEER